MTSLKKVVTAPSQNAFKGRLNKHWSRHPAKFNAACYDPDTTTSQRNNNRKGSPIEIRLYKSFRTFIDVEGGKKW